MAGNAGSRTRAPEVTIDLPPPFRLIKLREVGEAFVQAQSLAASAGAGTLLYVGRFDVIEFAVVLEPEEPLQLARRALYLGLNALGDALTALGSPGSPVTFGWPGAIHVNGGLVMRQHQVHEVSIVIAGWFYGSHGCVHRFHVHHQGYPGCIVRRHMAHPIWILLPHGDRDDWNHGQIQEEYSECHFAPFPYCCFAG